MTAPERKEGPFPPAHLTAWEKIAYVQGWNASCREHHHAALTPAPTPWPSGPGPTPEMVADAVYPAPTVEQIARRTLEFDDSTEHRSRETEVEERERVIATVVAYFRAPTAPREPSEDGVEAAVRVLRGTLREPEDAGLREMGKWYVREAIRAYLAVGWAGRSAPKEPERCPVCGLLEGHDMR